MDRRTNQTIRCRCIGRPFFMKLHLKKGDDGTRTGTLPLKKKKGKWGPMRQRPDFREGKQTHRQLYKEHVESTGEGYSSVLPVDQTRQSHRQHFQVFEEYNYIVHPRTGWKDYPSTCSSSSVHWQARRLGVESKLGLLAIFNLD